MHPHNDLYVPPSLHEAEIERHYADDPSPTTICAPSQRRWRRRDAARSSSFSR